MKAAPFHAYGDASLLVHEDARSRFGEIVESLDLVGDGKLTPVVHGIFPLAEAADAHRLMESRAHTGKILVAP